MYFIKPVEELRFTDDFMFSYVMRNKDICREVIRRLLKIEAREIKFPEAQKTIAPIYSGKGIRLDVYTETPDEVVDTLRCSLGATSQFLRECVITSPY